MRNKELRRARFAPHKHPEHLNKINKPQFIKNMAGGAGFYDITVGANLIVLVITFWPGRFFYFDDRLLSVATESALLLLLLP